MINEALTEVEPEEVNMDSFRVMDELCPELWDGNELKSNVRLQLLDIADDFVENLEIKWMKPKDIYLTGSLANYNWSKYSDVDVHIVYDYSEIYKRKDFVEEYFKAKRQLWNDKHDELTIYGYNVEMGTEDSAEPLPSSGVYSLNKGEWIRKPEPMSYDEIDEPYVKRESARIMTIVDEIEPLFDKEDDTHKKGVLAAKVKRMLSDLKEKRKKGLRMGGEMNSDNIIYKLLRRGKYLERMRDIVDRGYDAENSITENEFVEMMRKSMKLNESESNMSEQWRTDKPLSKEQKKVVDIVKDGTAESNTEKSKIRCKEAFVDKFGTLTCVLWGGLNGPGEWENYFRDLYKIIKKVKEKGVDMWLICGDNDCPDDLFSFYFGIRKEKDGVKSLKESRSLNEGIEEYATDRFNTDEFAGLPFAKKVQYCREHLGNPVGNGSSRMVFDAGGGKVLKLAKNKKGLAQNLVEIQNSNDYLNNDMYPKVFEADEENGTYIIAEFAEKAKKSQFKQRIGVTYDEFVHFCRGFESEYAKRSWLSVDLTPEEYDIVESNGTLNAWYYYISNVQPYNVGEITALRNLGFVQRDGDYELVIVDSGFDEDVAKMYGPRESVEGKVFVITESQAQLLMEALTSDELYNQYYNDLDKNVFDAAVKADPTTNGTKPGKFVKWILNMARKGAWKPGDSYETKKALNLFVRFGGKLEQRDINKYASVGDLYNTVSQFENQETHGEEQRKQKQEADKVYEDKDWIVVIPRTKEAAKLYGKGTKWCTAAENHNMFDRYNPDGPLYIIIPKHNDKKKWQFHFESDQFMDERDEQIPSIEQLSYYGNTEGLFKFLISVDKKMHLFPKRRMQSIQQRIKNGEDYDAIFDEVQDANFGFVKVKVNGLYNYMSENGALLSDIWFYNATTFDENGLAIVEYNRYYDDVFSGDYYDEGVIFHDYMRSDSDEYEANYLNTEGRFLFENPDCYLTYAGSFDQSDMANVECYDEESGGIYQNYINKNGDLMLPLGFENVNEVEYNAGVFVVMKNDKYTIWSIENGCMYGKPDYTSTWANKYIVANSKNIIALGFYSGVKKDENGKDEYAYKWKVFDKNGRLLSNQMFDEVGGDGVISMEDGNDGYVFNMIKSDGNAVVGNIDDASTWVDGIGYAGDGFYAVVKNGVANFVNEEGEYISKNGYDRIVTRFKEGYAAVGIGEKEYVIDTEGNVVSPGFEKICSSVEWYAGNGVYLVKIKTGGLYYFYSLFDKKIIQNIGMSECYSFSVDKKTGIVRCWCIKDDNDYLMDTNGNIYDFPDMGKLLYRGNIG